MTTGAPPRTADFFHPDARAGIDLAKQSVPKGAELDTPLLMAALYHAADLDEDIPQLAGFLDAPEPIHASPPDEVPLANSLRPLIGELTGAGSVVTADELFRALLQSGEGRSFLKSRGASDADIKGALAILGGEHLPGGAAPTTDWRKSEDRRKAMEALASFGRMLTEGEPPHKGIVEMEVPLKRLQKVLVKMKRRNAIVIGHPGTGKSALVYELARRIATGDPTVAPKLRDKDIFELSPTFLKSGASMVGQYEERLTSLLKVLEANPNIILFVDEIHSLLQSGMHERGPFTDANQAFKQALGDLSVIGATTTAEYRHYIAPDGALARRFSVVKLDPPSKQATVTILKARLPRLAAHYEGLEIGEHLLERTVDISEEYLPGRFQPDKSILLLDEACAWCAIQDPPLPALTEDALMEAVSDTIGHSVVRPEALTEKSVLKELKKKIVGQDPALAQLARSFVAGLQSTWRDKKQPRGIFFFCGPTGVGKTETAKVLGRILGGGEDRLLRIDCNTLQTSGLDSGPVINRLLGSPPGYVGYVRGQGGVLSAIRDNPECIVLFDEIEKADSGIGEILLQILDEGRVEDTDSNLLDFRRAFIIFTTNAGCSYESTDYEVGFGAGRAVDKAGEASPKVDIEAVKGELRRRGYGEEFLGRNIDYITFKGLDEEAIRIIVGRQLASLAETAELQGYDFDWSPEIEERLAALWQPRFGVRHLTTILRHRVVEQLSVAEAQGELRNVTRIELVLGDIGDGEVAGLAHRTLEGETMRIHLT